MTRGKKMMGEMIRGGGGGFSDEIPEDWAGRPFNHASIDNGGHEAQIDK